MNIIIMKKCIYYWYVSDFWCDLYDIHLESIRYYLPKCNFDEIVFAISYDDIKNKNITKVVNLLKDISPNANFIYVKNDSFLRESLFFYNEIYKKLETYNENDSIFFGHCKGANSNYLTKYNLLHWINFLYFGTLFYKERIEEALNDKDTLFAGSLIIPEYQYHNGLNYRFFEQNNKWYYNGTFYWLKPKKIYDYIQRNSIIIPECNRFFDETFPGNVCPNNKVYNKDILKFEIDLLEFDKFIYSLDNATKLDYFNSSYTIYSNILLNERTKQE